MTLLEKRISFTKDTGLLIGFATALGLDMVLCESLRSPEAAQWNADHCRVQVQGKRCEQFVEAHTARHTFRPIGIAHSLHVNGLAADFLIMSAGAIVNESDDYQRLGEFWKGLRDGNAWGGDFTGFADWGHYSREHNGRK